MAMKANEKPEIAWKPNMKYAPADRLRLLAMTPDHHHDPTRADELAIAREWKRRLQQEVALLEQDEERIRRLEAQRDVRAGLHEDSSAT